MQHFTVRSLKEQLEQLIEEGFGDRAVSFPKVEDDEGYDGTYVLVRRVDTRDALEVAVYLLPFDSDTNNELWEEIEAEGNARLDAEIGG